MYCNSTTFPHSSPTPEPIITSWDELFYLLVTSVRVTAASLNLWRPLLADCAPATFPMIKLTACSYPCNNSYCPVRRVAELKDLLLGSVLFCSCVLHAVDASPPPLHLPWLIKSVHLCVRKWQVRRTGRHWVYRNGCSLRVAATDSRCISNSFIFKFCDILAYTRCLFNDVLSHIFSNVEWLVSARIEAFVAHFETLCRYLSWYACVFLYRVIDKDGRDLKSL